jgi:thiamine biosynthesis protein ThiS
MQVLINGEPREIPAGLTVAGLVETLGLEPARVAVELDREIVRRPDWGGRVLGEGARLEIVHFVGGG